MTWLIFLFFIGVPIAEIAVLISAGEAIGLWMTIGLVILTAACGATLARAEGRVAMQRLATVSSSDAPLAVIDAAAIFIGAVLLLTPGFITDAVGLSLVFRPTRLLWAQLLLRYLRSRRGRGYEEVIIEGEFSETRAHDAPSIQKNHQSSAKPDQQ